MGSEIPTENTILTKLCAKVYHFNIQSMGLCFSFALYSHHDCYSCIYLILGVKERDFLVPLSVFLLLHHP